MPPCILCVAAFCMYPVMIVFAFVCPIVFYVCGCGCIYVHQTDSISSSSYMCEFVCVSACKCMSLRAQAGVCADPFWKEELNESSIYRARKKGGGSE